MSNSIEDHVPLIHLGTSSWQFNEWRGIFFPEKLAKQRHLSYYATQFNSVEINTSFYGVPRPSTLINWVESVPAGFTFCLKFPRAITHDKRLVGCEQETLIFLDVLRSLGEAAAPGLIQFPPDFSRNKFGKRLADYLDWLADQLDAVRVGIEVRSPDLMTPAFATFLAERNMAYVLVDHENKSDAYEFWEGLIAAGSAPGFTLIRWIGDEKNGPKGNDVLVAPRDAQLDEWAKRLARLQASGVEVYGYMHNPYEGHSPASLRRLQERLAPVATLQTWPPPGTTIPGAAEDDSAQLSLF